MTFDEWTPQYDSPESQEARAIEFGAKVGPQRVLLRLAACYPRDIEGHVLERIRAILMPKPTEVPPAITDAPVSELRAEMRENQSEGD